MPWTTDSFRSTGRRLGALALMAALAIHLPEAVLAAGADPATAAVAPAASTTAAAGIVVAEPTELKIANRSFGDADARIRFDGPSGALLTTPAAPVAADGVSARIEANTVRAVRVFVTLPEQAGAGTSLPVTFTVTLPEGAMTVKSTFITDPGARP